MLIVSSGSTIYLYLKLYIQWNTILKGIFRLVDDVKYTWLQHVLSPYSQWNNLYIANTILQRDVEYKIYNYIANTILQRDVEFLSNNNNLILTHTHV